MQDDETLPCWRCGAALETVPLPISRQAYCPACRADLHVCRMCAEFDPRVARQCRTDLDDVPHEKERANFCELFTPAATYRVADDSGARKARAELEALFGLPGEQPASGESKSEAARRELEGLFGIDPKPKK